MFKVIIIEDDDFKFESLSDYLYQKQNEIEISKETNLFDAVKNIENNEYDLALIDMSIPSHPIVLGGSAPINLLKGGVEFLLELKLLDKNLDCIIITQYPEIEINDESFPIKESKDKLLELIECKVLDCIEYHDGSNEWKVNLDKVLSKYENFNS